MTEYEQGALRSGSLVTYDLLTAVPQPDQLCLVEYQNTTQPDEVVRACTELCLRRHVPPSVAWPAPAMGTDFGGRVGAGSGIARRSRSRADSTTSGASKASNSGAGRRGGAKQQGQSTAAAPRVGQPTKHRGGPMQAGGCPSATRRPSPALLEGRRERGGRRQQQHSRRRLDWSNVGAEDYDGDAAAGDHDIHR